MFRTNRQFPLNRTVFRQLMIQNLDPDITIVEPTSLPSGSMCRLIRLRTRIVQNGIMGHDQDQAAESRQDAHLPMELLSYHPSVASTKIFHREMNDKHNYPGYRRISSLRTQLSLFRKHHTVTQPRIHNSEFYFNHWLIMIKSFELPTKLL